jgi:hypothetical protein
VVGEGVDELGAHFRVGEQETNSSRRKAPNSRTRGVRLAAVVTACGTDSCRVGIVAQAWVNKPMPEWLVRLAIQVVFPRILRDLDLEVHRKFPKAKKRWVWW